jgi:hypothetical protein
MSEKERVGPLAMGRLRKLAAQKAGMCAAKSDQVARMRVHTVQKHECPSRVPQGSRARREGERSMRGIASWCAPRVAARAAASNSAPASLSFLLPSTLSSLLSSKVRT